MTIRGSVGGRNVWLDWVAARASWVEQAAPAAHCASPRENEECRAPPGALTG